MKKTILVTLVAAMMLFAFTACDNSTPAVYNGVVSAEVQQVKGYFKGETAAEDGFQIVVNYAEGSPRIIQGNKGTIDLTTAGIAKATDDIVLKDIWQNNVSIVPAEVVYSDVTSATVSGVDVYTVTEGWSAADFDKALADKKVPEGLENLTFTFTGDNVTRTYTLEDKFDGTFDYQLWLYKDGGDTPLGYSEKVEAGDKYEVMLYSYKIGKGEMTAFGGKGLATGMTVSAVEKEDESVTDIVVRYSVNGDEDVATLPTLYSGDKVTVKVYPVSNGTVADEPTTATLSFVNMTAGTAPTSGTTFDVATASSTVTATATGTVRVTINQKIYQEQFSIGAGASYFTVTGLAAKYADQATSITAPHTFGSADVTPTVSWTGTTGTPSITYTFDQAAVPADYEGTFSTLCTATWIEKGKTKTLTQALSFTVNNPED